MEVCTYNNEMPSAKLFDLIKKADANKDASFELGMMYLNGNQVRQDTQRAIFYFEQASKQGHLGVDAVYGYLYKCGAPNLEPNPLKAAESFEFAGLYTGYNAILTDETLLWEAVNMWLYGGEGKTPLDKERGVDLLRAMCARGVSYAMVLMGEIYSKGLWGVAKDKNVANKWYRKSEEKCPVVGFYSRDND